VLESTFTQGGGGFEMKDGDKFVRVVDIRNAIEWRMFWLEYLLKLFSLPEYIMEVNYSKN